MGQKVNPHGLRVGVIKDWDSKWYAEKDFADNLVEDHKTKRKERTIMILKEAVLRRKISRARQTIKEECNYGRKKISRILSSNWYQTDNRWT